MNVLLTHRFIPDLVRPRSRDPVEVGGPSKGRGRCAWMDDKGGAPSGAAGLPPCTRQWVLLHPQGLEVHLYRSDICTGRQHQLKQSFVTPLCVNKCHQKPLIDKTPFLYICVGGKYREIFFSQR